MMLRPVLRESEKTASRVARPLARLIRHERSSSRKVERQRARSMLRALRANNDADSLKHLLRFADAERTLARAPSPQDDAALAEKLRDAGYPLSSDALRRFKAERGLVGKSRTEPELARAFVRLTAGKDAKIDLQHTPWAKLDLETQRALRLLLHMPAADINLGALCRVLGLPKPKACPHGQPLIGLRLAKAVLQWTHRFGFGLTDAGLAKVARVLGHAAPLAVGPHLAHLVGEGILAVGEPAADYRLCERDGHKLNRRTAAMLQQAAAHLGTASLPARVIQGSYQKPSHGLSRPHSGGGVVDLLLVIGFDAPKVVMALRQAGFAAWYRKGGEVPHIHAVAIGDRDLAATAEAQLRSYFQNGDAHTYDAADPHGGMPSWVLKYSIRYRA